MKKQQAYILSIAGGFGSILGGAFIVMYIWEAIISRIGEADQSLLFWYLPILFIGLVATGGGLSLFFLGIKHIKTTKKDRF